MGVSIINLLVSTGPGSSSYGQYIQLTSPTLWGFQSLQKSSKILLSISLEGEPGHCPKASLLFLLTVSPLTLHPLPSLISNCLNLLFGIQGRSRRRTEAYFLLPRNGRHRKVLVPISTIGPWSVSVYVSREAEAKGGEGLFPGSQWLSYLWSHPEAQLYSALSFTRHPCIHILNLLLCNPARKWSSIFLKSSVFHFSQCPDPAFCIQGGRGTFSYLVRAHRWLSYLTCIYISILGMLIIPSLNLHGKKHACACILSLHDFMGSSQPGFSVHGIFQARMLEWVAISYSRGSSLARDWTQVSCIAALQVDSLPAEPRGNRKAQISIPFSGEISRGGREHFCPLSTSNSCFHTERAVTSLIEIGRSDWTPSVGIVFSFLL